MTNIDTSTEAVAALLEGVTPGPWLAEKYKDSIGGESIRVVSADGDLVCDNEPYYPHAVTEPNARVIAAARDLVPALAAERDALAMRVAEL